jgi:hypothetical protein
MTTEQYRKETGIIFLFDHNMSLQHHMSIKADKTSTLPSTLHISQMTFDVNPISMFHTDLHISLKCCYLKTLLHILAVTETAYVTTH